MHPHRIKINLHITRSLKCTINIQLCGCGQNTEDFSQNPPLATILMRLEALAVHYPQNGCLISQLHYKGDNSIQSSSTRPGLSVNYSCLGCRQIVIPVNQAPEMMAAEQDVHNYWMWHSKLVNMMDCVRSWQEICGSYVRNVSGNQKEVLGTFWRAQSYKNNAQVTTSLIHTGWDCLAAVAETPDSAVVANAAKV